MFNHTYGSTEKKIDGNNIDKIDELVNNKISNLNQL